MVHISFPLLSFCNSNFWIIVLSGWIIIISLNSFLLIERIYSDINGLLKKSYNRLNVNPDDRCAFLISEIDEINNCFFKYKEKLYNKFSDELNQKNEFLFLTSISSHDLNSLNTITQGNIELLAGSDLDAQQTEYLEDIKAASDDSQQFIENLIQYLNTFCLERYNMSLCSVYELLSYIKQDNDIITDDPADINKNALAVYDKELRIYAAETLRAFQVAIGCLERYTNNSESCLKVDMCTERDMCIFSINNMGKPFTQKVLAQYDITSSRRCICDNANESRFIIQLMYVKKILEMEKGSMRLVNIHDHPMIELCLPIM